MKCPQCGYTTFDHMNECNKCGVDFSQPYVKKKFKFSINLPKWTGKNCENVDFLDETELADEHEYGFDQTEGSVQSLLVDKTPKCNTPQQAKTVAELRGRPVKQQSATSAISAKIATDITLNRSKRDKSVESEPPPPLLKKKPLKRSGTKNEPIKNTTTKKTPPEIGTGAPSLPKGKQVNIPDSGKLSLDSEPKPSLKTPSTPSATMTSTIPENSVDTFATNLAPLPSLKQFENQGTPSRKNENEQSADDPLDVGSMPTPAVVVRGGIGKRVNSSPSPSPSKSPLTAPAISPKGTPSGTTQSSDLPSLHTQSIGGFQDSAMDAFSSPPSFGDTSSSLLSGTALQSSAQAMPELKDVSGQEQLPTKFSFGSTIDVKPKGAPANPSKPNQRTGYSQEREEPDTQKMVSELKVDTASFGSKIRNAFQPIFGNREGTNPERGKAKSAIKKETQNATSDVDGDRKKSVKVDIRTTYRDFNRRHGFTITVICSVIIPFLSMIIAAIIYGYSVAGLPVHEQFFGGILLVAAFAFLPYPFVVYCCWRAVQRRVLVAEWSFLAVAVSLLAGLYLRVPNDPASENLFLFLPAGQWVVVVLYAVFSNLKKKRSSVTVVVD